MKKSHGNDIMKKNYNFIADTRVLVCLGLILLFIGGASLAVEMDNAIIQIAKKPSWQEKHCADELQKYIRLLTKNTIRIVSSDILPKSRIVFLIGTAGDNSIIEEYYSDVQIGRISSRTDKDSFVIKSFKRGDQQQIVIFRGNNQRSTLYAVYDYLENECGVGFFPDGEYVPSIAAMPVKNINRVEISRFKYRWYLRWNRVVMKKYTNRWHTLPELKREIDWEAKSKFNLRGSGSITANGVGMGGITEDVFNVPPEPEELSPATLNGDWWFLNWFMPPDFILDRKEKANAYAHKLGFTKDIWVPYGQVPRYYKQSHPEHIYVEGEGFNLHPKDPAATETTKEMVRRTIKRFGTDHFYSMNAYGEHAPGKDPLQLKIDASLNTARLLRQLDPSPELIWRWDGGWDFMINPGGIYTKESVKKFLDAMPDFLYVADNTFNMLEETMYERYDYFYGKKWALALVHDLGGDDQLHGDIADVVEKTLKVVNSAKGDNCIGFHIVPENANCSIMYWYCVAKLAWNPKGWTTEGLIRNFCVHRYGKRSAENMYRYWKIINDMLDTKESWGGKNFLNRPIYQIALRFEFENVIKKQFPDRIIRAKKMVNLFDRALHPALKEWDNQKDNVLYENDLIDFIRTYIGKLSDFYFISAVNAIESKNKEDYLKYRKKCIEVMKLSAKLMSTRPDYSLSDTIRTINKFPGANRYTEVGLKMSQYGQGYDTFDNYEQMIFCYIPMMEYIMDWVEGKYPDEPLAVGSHQSQNPIKRQWLLSPLDPPQETGFDGTPREAIKFVIDQLVEIVDKSN